MSCKITFGSVVVVCLACVALGRTEGIDLNTLTDQVLDQLRPKIIDMGLDELPISDINYNWSYTFLFFSITGKVACSDGKVRAMSTLKRTGDATGELVDGALVVNAKVGLDILSFDFPYCKISARNILTITNPLGGSVKENSISFQVTANYVDGKCVATLDKLYVENLSGIIITTGSSAIAKLESRVINGLLNEFQGVVLGGVNRVVRSLEGRSLPVDQFCKAMKG